LSIAMHGGRLIVIPLLQLKEFDQYTTTHSMNVAVLAIALAESRGLSPRDVRAFGVRALLHDIGKVKIPLDVLTKPGRSPTRAGLDELASRRGGTHSSCAPRGPGPRRRGATAPHHAERRRLSHVPIPA